MSPMGTMRAAVNPVLQVMSELGEFVDVAFNATDVSLELCQDFVDIGGDFRHRAREDGEIVVAIHLEFAEFGRRGSPRQRRWCSPAA